MKVSEGPANRLAKEKSPYLLQHSRNPVDWYAWGDEALKKAKNDGKPVFLSIGYSTCHWCHVMAEESFEDEKTAAFINKNFIAIKVDREERPEVDAYYMAAVQTLTGGGGWPLSVFLTPDLKPFYGGTYFPPEPRYGMPSFRQVLEFVANVWKDEKGEVLQNSSQLAAALSEKGSGSGSTLSKEVLDDGYASLLSTFDQERGGFGGPPKFPLPMASMFLLRYNLREGKEMALSSVLKTLDAMAAGGIRDHVGGGFHRYSTDRVWLVPHFEKMLYDNALLARLYTEAYLRTGKEEYLAVAKETLGWILGEMRDKEGGFYSAQDADTTEGEGVYYTWTPEELARVLGEGDGRKFAGIFGVTQTGNSEGRSILHLSDLASAETVKPEIVRKWKEALYTERLRRPRPSTDKKVLTSWNGLVISSLAMAYSAFEEPEYARAAEEAAEFLERVCKKDGRLLRRYAGGEAALEGTLEDYAFFIQGLIDLFEATSEPRWLKEATSLAEEMVDGFEDEGKGGFFLTLDATPARLKEGYDGTTPSGNSVAAVDLIRLFELTGKRAFRESAERVLKTFGKDIEQQPAGHANMLIALDLLLNGMMEVVITAPTSEAARPMKEAVLKRFVPNKVVMVATRKNFVELEGMTELLEGRKPTAKARAYVCVNFACKLPVGSAEALVGQLGA